MLTHMGKYLLLTVLISAFACAAAPAGENQPGQELSKPLQKPIYKVKPAPEATPETPAPVWKVKPRFDLDGLAQYNPLTWGAECFLPTAAPRQFEAGAEVWFGRIQGQIAKGGGFFLPGEQPSVVDFDDHLGMGKSGNVMWKAMAHYQVAPRWGIHYSFSPFTMEATGTSQNTFTFMGTTVVAGTPVRSRWDRYEHRAGLVFDVTRSPNSVTSLYADWMYIQDKVAIRQALGGLQNMVWDADKNLAVAGIELKKCLKNFRGNTLALNCKAGIAFLDDHNGYELEAGLSYILPIKQGRFGFLKGGYRYAQLTKDKNLELFKTKIDGAFVEAGFIF
ncbi:MAG: hypothetical protein AB1733_00995 [Thermodesulfobacteriota bacterium]